MKNHIALKFLAVILCAAALLAALGSGAGILVLTEADLYEKTPDQVYRERIQSDIGQFAQSLAFRYASTNLGGCPEEMLDDYGYDSWFYSYYDMGCIGYTLKDADGNVLESLPMEDGADAVTCEFPAAGQYLYLVSVQPESEKFPPVVAPDDPAIDTEERRVYDDVPAEGAAVYEARFYDAEGFEIYGLADQGLAGYIFPKETGSVVFRSAYPGDTLPDAVVAGAVFLDDSGNLIYDAYSPEGVGELTRDENGNVLFTSLAPDADAADAVSDPTAAAEPDGIADGEDAFLLYDAVPPEGAEVTHFTVTYADGSSEGVGSDQGIGFLIYKPNSGLFFQTYDPGILELSEDAAVTHIVFRNADDILYEAIGEGAAGRLSQDEDGYVVYRASASEVSGVPETAEIPETIPQTAAGETQPEETAAPETAEDETIPEAAAADGAGEETTPETIPETIPESISETTMAASEEAIREENVASCIYYDPETDERMYAEYCFVDMPDYTVELTMLPGAYRYESAYSVLGLVWEYRNALFAVLGVSVLLFAILAVYLCCAAGRKPGTGEIHAGGLNCIPLDLYAAGAVLGIAGIVCLGAEGGDYLLRQSFQVGCAFVVAAGYVCCLLFVGFWFAFAAQVKTPGGYWWRDSVCGRCLLGCWAVCAWLHRNGLRKLWNVGKKAWGKLWIVLTWLLHFAKRLVLTAWEWVKKACTFLGRKLARLYGLLPLTWQWLLTGMILLLLLFIAVASRSEGMLMLCLCGGVAIVLYGAGSFGTLLESAKRMSEGDLETKVEDKFLIGSFKDFAGRLNALADVAVIAAQKQLKSERMKTELITNVSHDIKTPLTSIINYVDLLEKPHTPEEQETYLEVLSRQSQRLKKLIDDLMEMSKASTGNLPVEIARVNAAEAINQALGEFADKLEKVQLFPVFRQPESPITMLADGRLVWRVMSNLLSNAVKYALPGTRLYVDLMQLDGKVVISLKNISREELNVSADELLERFVRGDTARNTEGSGLGLNIAQSLMELQKGQLQLLVDGDLFKVTLIFPGA